MRETSFLRVQETTLRSSTLVALPSIFFLYFVASLCTQSGNVNDLEPYRLLRYTWSRNLSFIFLPPFQPPAFHLLYLYNTYKVSINTNHPFSTIHIHIRPASLRIAEHLNLKLKWAEERALTQYACVYWTQVFINSFIRPAFFFCLPFWNDDVDYRFLRQNFFFFASFLYSSCFFFWLLCFFVLFI